MVVTRKAWGFMEGWLNAPSMKTATNYSGGLNLETALIPLKGRTHTKQPAMLFVSFKASLPTGFGLFKLCKGQ